MPSSSASAFVQITGAHSGNGRSHRCSFQTPCSTSLSAHTALHKAGKTMLLIQNHIIIRSPSPSALSQHLTSPQQQLVECAPIDLAIKKILLPVAFSPPNSFFLFSRKLYFVSLLAFDLRVAPVLIHALDPASDRNYHIIIPPSWHLILLRESLESSSERSLSHAHDRGATIIQILRGHPPQSSSSLSLAFLVNFRRATGIFESNKIVRGPVLM